MSDDEPDDELTAWIATLRDRLDRGEFVGTDPLDLGDGTGALTAGLLIRVMLADLEDLDDPDGSYRLDGEHPHRATCRGNLLRDFKRLRALLG
jgi:hypothetical protein